MLFHNGLKWMVRQEYLGYGATDICVDYLMEYGFSAHISPAKIRVQMIKRYGLYVAVYCVYYPSTQLPLCVYFPLDVFWHSCLSANSSISV